MPGRPDTEVVAIVKPAAWLVLGAMTAASAQEDPAVEAQYHPDEIPTCNVASASRTREACGLDSSSATRVGTERELSFSLELAAPAVRQCEMGIHSEYYQRDTFVSVEQVINNETCGASGGHYDNELEVEDETGARRTLAFRESWQRDDDRSVTITVDYPIGDNVELIRLRSLGLSCTCAEDGRTDDSVAEPPRDP